MYIQSVKMYGNMSLLHEKSKKTNIYCYVITTTKATIQSKISQSTMCRKNSDGHREKCVTELFPNSAGNTHNL